MVIWFGVIGVRASPRTSTVASGRNSSRSGSSSVISARAAMGGESTGGSPKSRYS